MAQDLLINTFMRRKGRDIEQSARAGVAQRSLRLCFHLLAKSCERYGSLKQSKAPAILVDVERDMIRQRLLFLFNIDLDRV